MTHSLIISDRDFGTVMQCLSESANHSAFMSRQGNSATWKAREQRIRAIRSDLAAQRKARQSVKAANQIEAAVTTERMEGGLARERYGDDWEDRIKAYNILATHPNIVYRAVAAALIEEVHGNQALLDMIDCALKRVEGSLPGAIA